MFVVVVVVGVGVVVVVGNCSLCRCVAAAWEFVAVSLCRCCVVGFGDVLRVVQCLQRFEGWFTRNVQWDEERNLALSVMCCLARQPKPTKTRMMAETETSSKTQLAAPTRRAGAKK